MSDKQRAYPVIIVTGANGGVGYAICQRLLLQLVQRVPSDALPQRRVSQSLSIDENATINIEDFTSYEGLTLILACRDVQKAEQAREDLQNLLDTEITRLQGQNADEAEHARRFRENVKIVTHRLDLASIESIFNFSRLIKSSYPYVSHLVCNAGVASFSGYDWPLAIKQIVTDFIGSVSAPVYKIQRVGELSEDGLGWVWQCNVFGHYILVRLLEPLLEKYEKLSETPARVLWMSSLEARADCYDPNDLQLIRTNRSYEASKYQIDLLVEHFEHQQYNTLQKGQYLPIRHFICHPGVVRTNIAVKSLNSTFLDLCMQFSFLLAHFLGSPVHVISPYKSAISAVHLMLVALPFISIVSKSEKEPVPHKFGSCVDYWFNEYVSAEEAPEYGDHRQDAARLAERCESLFQEFRKKEEASPS